MCVYFIVFYVCQESYKNWFDRLTFARLRDKKKQIRHLASEDVLDYVLTSSSDTQDRETNTDALLINSHIKLLMMC